MSDITRAIAAATSIAASLDLPVNDAIVLHNSNKLALRLTPSDVFARVAPVGEEVAQFEIELAQRLAEVGSPVAALEPRVEPLVYTRDGFAVTLWTYHEPVTPSVTAKPSRVYTSGSTRGSNATTGLPRSVSCRAISISSCATSCPIGATRAKTSDGVNRSANLFELCRTTASSTGRPSDEAMDVVAAIARVISGISMASPGYRRGVALSLAFTSARASRHRCGSSNHPPHRSPGVVHIHPASASSQLAGASRQLPARAESIPAVAGTGRR